MIERGKINGFVGISPIPVPANMKCNQNLIFPSPFCNTIVVSSRFNQLKSKKMRRLSAVLFVFLLAIAPLAANENPVDVASPGALTGRVVDEAGYVLPGATIVVEGTNLGTVSDVNGFFRLNGLSDGNYTAKITYSSFASC
jgi:hypothetical protein